MFTVKEAAEIMGISPHSLRFYDKEGLFPSLARTESGRRMFSYEELEWVYTIQCWRATGMPLAEVNFILWATRNCKNGGWGLPCSAFIPLDRFMAAHS